MCWDQWFKALADLIALTVVLAPGITRLYLACFGLVLDFVSMM